MEAEEIRGGGHKKERKAWRGREMERKDDRGGSSW